MQMDTVTLDGVLYTYMHGHRDDIQSIVTTDSPSPTCRPVPSISDHTTLHQVSLGWISRGDLTRLMEIHLAKLFHLQDPIK